MVSDGPSSASAAKTTALPRLGGLFEDASHYKVGSEDAVARTGICKIMAKLPAEARSVLPANAQALADALQSCAQKYEWAVEGREPYAKTGNKKNLDRALTLPEFLTVIWDCLAGMLFTWLENLLHLGPSKRRKRQKGICAEKGRPKQNDFEKQLVWQTVAGLIVDALPRGPQNMLEPITSDELLEMIEEACASSIGACIDRDVLEQHLAPVHICLVEPTPFLAETFMRSRIMDEMLGDVLSKELRRFQHGQHFDIDAGFTASSDLATGLTQELVAAKTELARLRSHVLQNQGMPMDPQIIGQSLIIRHTAPPGRPQDDSIDLALMIVKFAIASKTAFTNAPSTLAEAAGVMHFARLGELSGAADALEYLCSRHTIARYALLLDHALDEDLKERIHNERGKTYFGFGFASDESPPKSNRYVGLRFQITFIDVLFFAPVSSWSLPEYETDYPFKRERHLCDVVNCPGKSGSDVMKCLTMQFAGKGVNSAECCVGCGDGGGENEGTAGVHSLLEAWISP